jgi:hypothetical protein
MHTQHDVPGTPRCFLTERYGCIKSADTLRVEGAWSPCRRLRTVDMFSLSGKQPWLQT